jgi:hypothetical protein
MISMAVISNTPNDFHGDGNDRRHQKHENDVGAIRVHVLRFRQFPVDVAAKSGRQIRARMTKHNRAAEPDDAHVEFRDGKNIAEQEAHEVHSDPGHEGKHNQAQRQGGMGQQAQQRVG